VLIPSFEEMTWNERIMPVTVPSSPSSGAIVIIVSSQESLAVSIEVSFDARSIITRSTVSTLLWMFAISVAIGFMLSTFSSDVVQSYAFSRLLSLLFATLPPVYYPISYVPSPFNYLAYLSPTTYAAEIMHAATGYLELSNSRLALNWVVLLAVCGIILAIAAKKTRWKDV
jgi:ABC-2 type transport system permease protein